MNKDLRRAKRYTVFFPVTVKVDNQTTPTSQPGFFAGRAINISRNGACLLLSLKTLESYEVYRSTSNVSRISFDLQNDAEEPLQKMTFSGYPVWIDSFLLDDLRAIKIGVEFSPETVSQQPKSFPEDLIKLYSTDNGCE